MKQRLQGKGSCSVRARGDRSEAKVMASFFGRDVQGNVLVDLLEGQKSITSVNCEYVLRSIKLQQKKGQDIYFSARN